MTVRLMRPERWYTNIKRTEGSYAFESYAFVPAEKQKPAKRVSPNKPDRRGDVHVILASARGGQITQHPALSRFPVLYQREWTHVAASAVPLSIARAVSVALGRCLEHDDCLHHPVLGRACYRERWSDLGHRRVPDPTRDVRLSRQRRSRRRG